MNILDSISSIATALGVIVVAIQLALGIKQARKDAEQRRIQYIIDLYQEIVNDKEMYDLFYDIEYNRFIYSKSIHATEKEKIVDKLIGQLAKVAVLFEKKILSDEDMKFFEYEYLAVFNDSEIQKYLSALTEQVFLPRNLIDHNIISFQKVGKLLLSKKELNK